MYGAEELHQVCQRSFFSYWRFAGPMKILRVIISLDPEGGGPSEGIRRLTEALTRAGHVQEVMTLDSPDAPFVRTFPGKVHALGRPKRRLPQGSGRIWERFGYTPGAISWLKERAYQYDAVIVSGLWNYGNTAARFGLVNYRGPVLVFVHGMLAPWLKEFNSPVKHWAKQVSWFFNEGRLLARADRVLFTSSEEMVTARNTFWPYQINDHVISYGTGDAPAREHKHDLAFRRQCPSLGAKRYLLFLSRVYPKKGCDLLIEAFAKYASRMPDVDLVIAGPDQVGWAAELKRLAQSRGVGERVHWPGMVTGDAKWGAYYNADAFVLPSHHENFGIVVAEAMACAKPLLISDKINIWRETLEDGASFVEPDDQEGTDRLFERYVNASELTRAAMGSFARASFLKRFHIDNVARDLVALIERVKLERSC